MGLRLAACLLLSLNLGMGLTASASQTRPPATLTLGVLAFRGEESDGRRWAATADYLSERLAAGVRLVPCTLEQMDAALARGGFDFVLTNPGHYVELESRHGISRIATLKNLRHGRPYTVFGAVIFTRADRDDIRVLEDLHGKSFAAVAEAAFGGFQMAWRELRAAGIDPFADLARIDYTGFPQDVIVHKVRTGEVDAGTVRTDLLEHMANEGQIDLGDFRILNPRTAADFPFRHSTRLYPEWAFAKARATSDEVARAVAVALLQMPADHPAARAGRYAGWTVPLDYAPVHDLFRELEIGPYRRAPEWPLTRLLHEYWYVFALAAATVLFGVFHVVRADRLVTLRTRELSASKRELENEIAEREKIERRTRTLLQEKRYLARKCMAVQEDERRHLARELHDELGQCITAIQADAATIQELSRDRDRRLLASAQAIQDIAARIYAVVHNMMERLRPSALDHLGLADTLREEVAGWQARCPETRYALRMDGDLECLGEPVNISLYRIVQECLTNVAKHARARSVRLDLAVRHGADRGRVELEIADDGVGMDPAALGRGLGLIGIRERVEALGGRFELAGTPGTGIRIHISIPLAAGATTAPEAG